MDKSTRNCIKWLKRESLRRKLCDAYLFDIQIFETDTLCKSLSTASRNANLEDFMHKIGGVYQE